MGKTGVSWSDLILLVLLVVLAVGGAWLGIRIARWSRMDDGREWVDALSRLRGEEYAEANGPADQCGRAVSRRPPSASARETPLSPSRSTSWFSIGSATRCGSSAARSGPKCPPRSDWMVDEAMAIRVADALGYSSPTRAAEQPSRLSV